MTAAPDVKLRFGLEVDGGVRTQHEGPHDSKTYDFGWRVSWTTFEVTHGPALVTILDDPYQTKIDMCIFASRKATGIDIEDPLFPIRATLGQKVKRTSHERPPPTPAPGQRRPPDVGLDSSTHGHELPTHSAERDLLEFCHPTSPRSDGSRPGLRYCELVLARRLGVGELHLQGRVRITGIAYGELYFAEDVETKGGCEFVLILDDGESSEYKAFQLTDWLAHTPRDILRKNLKSGANPTRGRLTHKMLAQGPIMVPGGEVRIADSMNFPVTTVSAAHAVINRGARCTGTRMRWSMFLSGKAKVTVFTVQATRTYNFVASDVMIVPHNCRYYIENIGGEPIEMLEIFKAPKFEEFSLNRWLAVTSSHLVQAHLNVGEEFTKALDKGHTPIRDGHVAPDTGYAARNASGKPSAKL
ncbi:RmlC-like cupin domain-containing protein [Fomitopsis serialis]|uniref:RmlC-like cupin domain-containing protein n=1 Tax=Fomitopsis serialis TaxID=139415 RepID=UPI0020086ED0|nr:RmlC-like cupin domain-containing protein [Neoantrodia serialis]KAH9924061.1 RmlC-like cupin domain-containing protein [Neoantrodia serialis]